MRASAPRSPLPIDSVLDEIVHTVRATGALVLEAPPGAGKTTRVPVALYDAGLAKQGEILVSEPRRLAARLAARFVARERNEAVGKSIGYTVRFEDVSSASTRVRYVTDGVLVRRLLGSPRADGIAGIVLDEFHERRLATDLALALIARLRRERPELFLIVMSATLDAAPIAEFLGCPRVSSEGRRFDVDVLYTQKADGRPLELQVTSAVKSAVREADGDVLVFLPGAGEIRRAKDALGAFGKEQSLLVLPLHGDLGIEDQARAIEPAERRKVILSTNVAESSVTIDGVTTVVDSGLARVARHSPWSGLARLTVERVSRASATQRAGRAGRTRPGRALRLYSQGDFASRPEHDEPEIRRLDLAETWLGLLGAGIRDLAFLDAPPDRALASTRELLERLGATDPATQAITDTGRAMLRFALHPRLARLVVEGERRGVAREACIVASLLSERDIRREARAFAGGVDASGSSDVVELVDRFREVEYERFRASAIRAAGLDARSVQAVERSTRALDRAARNLTDPLESSERIEEAIGLALLAAFPDRVAKRRKSGAPELILATGEAARLGPNSVVHGAELMVAVDADERAAHGHGGGAIVRLAHAVDPEAVMEMCGPLVTTSVDFVWSESAERVLRVERVLVGSVSLDETRRMAEPSSEASRVLARAAIARGVRGFTGDDAAHQLAARIAWLRSEAPDAGLPDLGDDAAAGALAAACEGATSFAELRARDLADRVMDTLGPDLARLVREQAPASVMLGGGRRVPVRYEKGQAPFVESRLQDFFGASEGPRIAWGRVPLTLHLLAPNQRAVQVTTDLAGFWERHYPALRKQLSRRYPRHAWPEDGRTAKPPEPRRR